MSRLEKGESISLGVAVVAGIIGFLTSIGMGPLPSLPIWVAWLLMPLLALLGVAAGWAAGARMGEIEDARWSVARDELATQAEIELAHREAERQRRWASTVYLLAPLMLGYWSAYQVQNEDAIALASMLLVAPFLAFCIALGIQLWRLRDTGERLAGNTGLK